ncbi:methyltransferase family protein [Leifsonia sp. A12D58]|uniref:methyltransferase family protein n=1 Tax=Leifsonia sp. A12D58 TaxID=3397674 RepID=UPI0039DFCAD4
MTLPSTNTRRTRMSKATIVPLDIYKLCRWIQAGQASSALATFPCRQQIAIQAYSQKMRRALAFGLVVVQILLLVGLVLLPHGSIWPTNAFVVAAALVLIVVGVSLLIAGSGQLGSALTASPIPQKDAPLVTSGIYGFIRSPIYTGLITGGLGLTLLSGSLLHVFIWIALIGLLAIKARWEERMLIAQHPEYRLYGERVGRFIPGIGRLRPYR